MFGVGDIVRVGNDPDERKILSIYKTSDDRVFCGVGGISPLFRKLRVDTGSTINCQPPI